MNNTIKLSGNFEEGKSSNHFMDKRGRSDGRKNIGRYGADHSRQTKINIKPLSYAFELPLGDYRFGGSLHIDNESFGFGVGLSSQEPLKRYEIGKALSEFVGGEDFSEHLVGGLKDSFKTVLGGFDDVMVREILFEGPSAGISASLGKSRVGAGANAELARVTVILDTPWGELQGSLKAGAGVGRSIGAIKAKSGKPGVNKKSNFSVGVFEFSWTDNADEKKTSHRKRAKEVSAELAPSATEAKSSAQEQRVMDETAKIYAERFKDDAYVTQQYKTYLSSKDRAQGFVEYQKSLAKHFSEKESWDQFLRVGTDASIFLSELGALTGSRGLQKFSVGLSSTLKMFSGMQQLGGVLSAASAAGSLGGALSILSSSGLGPVGAILGGFSGLSSLFGGGGSDGLGEALEAIHSAIINMHQEMRESFQQTWEYLEHLDEKLNAIERNNVERFKYLLDHLSAMDKGLNAQLTTIRTDIGLIIDKLDDLKDKDVKTVLQALKFGASNEILTNLTSHAAVLMTWLKDAVESSGKYPVVHQQVSVDMKTLLSRLELGIDAKSHAVKYQLGFYGQLARSKFSEFPEYTPVSKESWFDVLMIYLKLLDLCQDKILTEGTTEAYLESISSLQSWTENTTSFYQSVANSDTFWKRLTDEYKNVFAELRKPLLNGALSLRERYSLPQDVPLLRMNETVESNANSFKDYPGLTANATWVNVNGTLLHSIADLKGTIYCKKGSTKCQSAPRDLLTFNERMFNSLINYQIDGSFSYKKILDLHPLKQLLNMLLAYRVILPSVGYLPLMTGNKEETIDYCVYFVLGFKLGNNTYPFLQGNLFFDEDRTSYRPNGIEDIAKYTKIDSFYKAGGSYFGPQNNVYWESFFVKRDEFEQLNETMLINALETNMLIPQRKDLARNINDDEVKFKYLTLMNFIHLIDPTFQPPREPNILKELKKAAQELAQTGSLESFNKVLSLLTDDIWSQELRGYIDPEHRLAEIRSSDVQSKVKQMLAHHPWQAKVTQASQALQRMALTLNPEENRRFLNGRLDAWESLLDAQRQNLTPPFAVVTTAWNKLIRLEPVRNITEEITRNHFEALQRSHTEVLALAPLQQELSELSSVKPQAKHQKQVYTPNADWSLLQQRCANPVYNQTEWEQLQIQLDAMKPAEIRQLEAVGVKAHPLALAIQAGRDDIVKLLLEHDVKLTFKTEEIPESGWPSDPAVNTRVRALLSFYGYMQENVSAEELYVGRTLKLISGCVQSFDFENKGEVSLFLGKSGYGKSTIGNIINGTEYEKTESDDGLVVLVPKNTSIPEVFKTNKATDSETICSETIRIQEGEYIADTPGFSDTRGTAWEIAGGLNIGMLGRYFEKIRALVFIGTHQDFNDIKLLNLRGSLEVLAKVINKNKGLVSNILFVINKSPVGYSLQQVQKRLKALQGDEGFSPEGKLMLAGLKPEQFFIMDDSLSSSEVKKALLEKIAEIVPKEIGAFNFDSYQTKTNEFKRLLSRLDDYQAALKQRRRKLEVHILESQVKELHQGLASLEDADVFMEQLPGCPQELVVRRDELKNRSRNQEAFRNDLIEFSYEMSNLLTEAANTRRRGENTQAETTIASAKIEEEIELLAAEERVAETFREIVDKAWPRGTVSASIENKAYYVEADIPAEYGGQVQQPMQTRRGGGFGPVVAEAIELDAQGRVIQTSSAPRLMPGYVWPIAALIGVMKQPLEWAGVVRLQALSTVPTVSPVALDTVTEALSSREIVAVGAGPVIATSGVLASDTSFMHQWHTNGLEIGYERKEITVSEVKACEIRGAFLMPEGGALQVNEATEAIEGGISYGLIGNGCDTADATLAYAYARDQVREMELQRNLSDLQSVAVESSISTGVTLLARDIMLSRGYSSEAAEWGAWTVSQAFSARRAAMMMYRGASLVTALLPMAVSMGASMMLSKLGAGSRTTSVVSNAISVGTSYMLGGGVFKAIATLTASSFVSQLVAMGEEKFANKFLLKNLSTRLLKVKEHYEEVEGLLSKMAGTEDLRENLGAQVKGFIKRAERYGCIEDYAVANSMLQRLESIKSRVLAAQAKSQTAEASIRYRQ